MAPSNNSMVPLPSSGCYKTLRNYGVLSLPSERILSDYKHFAPAGVGFCHSTDLQLRIRWNQAAKTTSSL